MSDRFDAFTDSARRVLAQASEEARRLRQDYIGTEHILLGLVREANGVTARVLLNLGIELATVGDAVELIIERGDRMVVGGVRLTPGAKKAVALAVNEAQRLNQRHIGSEFLLLGLVREGQSIAAGLLNSLGLTLGTLRAEVVRVQTAGAAAGSRWTASASSVMRVAVEEARQLNRPGVDGGLFLIALVKEPTSIAARTLELLGFDLARLVAVAQQSDLPVTGKSAGPKKFHPAVQEAMQRATIEAYETGSPFLNTGHLLIGMTDDNASLAAILLKALGGPSPEVIRATVHSLIADGGTNEL